MAMLLLCLVVSSSACRPGGGGGGGDGGWSGKPWNENDIPDHLLPNISSWGAWKPKDTEKSWKDWKAEYNNISTISNASLDERGYYHGKEPGFPKEWSAYGGPIVGVPMPPWAKIPQNYGRPDLCYQTPSVGHCRDRYIRWCFDPSQQECIPFRYTGCGGNENNFKFKSSCDQVCNKVPSPPCQPEKPIHFEDYIVN